MKYEQLPGTSETSINMYKNKAPNKSEQILLFDENSEKKEGVITFFIDPGYSKSTGKYRF